MSYLKDEIARRTHTPQNEAIPGRESEQTVNSAGGYVFEAGDFDRLRRFLILGSEGGSYYAGERELTRENAQVVQRCLDNDWQRTVRTIVEISEAGRAPKNDPAIFALALAASHSDENARKAALTVLPRVCRIGTHLFTFVDYIDGLRGWGRGLREAVAAWYTEKEPKDLAFQMAKYRQRNGWSHRDVLRLAHPKAESDEQRAAFDWACHPDKEFGLLRPDFLKGQPGFDKPHPLEIIEGVQRAQHVAQDGAASETSKLTSIVNLIQLYGLTHEMVPTEFKNKPAVQEALLEKMPIGALVRNLGGYTASGLLHGTSNSLAGVLGKLGNQEAIQKSRIHPLNVLFAMKTYVSGRGFRGSLSWSPVPQIVDALDALFYDAFGNVESTGKRWCLGLDVSGSMFMPGISTIAGTNVLAGEAAAAMAMVTAKSEPLYSVSAFSSGGWTPHDYSSGRHGGYLSRTGLVNVPLSPRQRLEDVINSVSGLPHGGTDCSLPMIAATEAEREFDVFVIYTDSETWYGDIHPTQALEQYRKASGIDAKLVVVGMVANQFTIADPKDPGMLDVVGFDTATPNVISEFVR